MALESLMFFMFKANDGPPVWRVQWPPDNQSCPKRVYLKREVHQHANITGGSNPASYKHRTGQTYTKQDRTKHKLKAGDKQNASRILINRRVQPLEATLLENHTQKKIKTGEEVPKQSPP